MTEHNHLDRQRRTRGECPACDLAWERQEARLAETLPVRNVISQLERMVDRPKLVGKFCTSQQVSRVHTAGSHLCGKLAAHQGPHFCPLCDLEW